MNKRAFTLPTIDQRLRHLALLGLGFSIVSLALLDTPSAQAATLTWDPLNLANGATIDPGSGTWNLAAPNVWNNAGTNVAWTQTSATVATNTAVFGGADGTYAITLGAALAAQSLTFNNSGYTLSATTAQTLSVSNTGTVISIAAGKSATIGNNATVALNGGNGSSTTIALGAGASMDIASGATLIKNGASAQRQLVFGNLANAAGNTAVFTVEGAVTYNVASGTGSIAVGQGSGTASTSGSVMVNVNSGGTMTTNSTGADASLGSIVLSNNAATSVLTLSGATSAINITNTSSTSGLNLARSGTGWTGTFNLDGGTLTTPRVFKGAIGAVGTGLGTFNFNGGTLKANVTNNTDFMQNLTNAFVKAGGAVIDTNTFNVTIAQNLLTDVVSTGGGLTKNSAGTLTLSGASTYTGATTINAGTLAVTGSLASGSAVAVNAGSTLAGTATGGGSSTVAGAITVAGGATAGTRGTISLVNGTFGTLNTGALSLGSATDPSQLSFDSGTGSTDSISLGANILTLNTGGSNITITNVGISAGQTLTLLSYGSGAGAGFATGTGITVGGLTLTNPALSFGISGTLNVTGTAVQLVTAGAATPAVAYWKGDKGVNWSDTLGTDGNFTTNKAGTIFVQAYPTGATDVIYAATGATNLATSTLGQNFAVKSLTFDATTSAASISGANTLTTGTGGITLESGNGGATLGMTTLALNTPQTFANASASDLTISAAISSANALTINNTSTGKTILSGINPHTGGITTSAGVLQVSGSGTLGATSNALTVNGGTVDLNDTTQTVGNLTGTGGTILNNGSTAKTFTIGGGNGTGGNYQGVIANNNNAGSGTVALTKTGTGTIQLSGANTYSGATNINGGVLQISASNHLGDASATNTLGFNAGTLESLGGTYDLGVNRAITLNGAGTILTDAGALTISGNVTNGANLLTVTGAGNTTISGVIGAGAGGLTKTGAGTLTLSNTNTFTGATSVSAGTLSLGAVDAINKNTLTISGTGTLTETVDNAIGGTTALVVQNSLVTLSRPNNYSGDTIINSGTNTTLTITNANGAGTARLLANAGSTNATFALHIDGGGTITMPNGIGAASGLTATIDVNNNGTGTNGVIQLANITAASTAFGSSTLNVTGGNGYSLAIAAINASSGVGGTMTLNPTTASLTVGPWNSSTAIAKTLALDGTSSSNSVTGAIGGLGAISLTKSNSSTWTLSGANTYTGNTAVNGGTLKVDNNGTTTLGKITGSAAANAIAVNSGGTLLLTGAGATDRLNDAAGITLNGGTLAEASGSSEGAAAIVVAGVASGTNTLGLGLLTLSATSTLDFDSIGNSTLLAFTGFAPGAFTLNVTNWTNTNYDGSLNSGLSTDDRFIVQQDLATAGFLPSINFGPGLAASQISLGGGFYEIGVTPVPEPGAITVVLALLGFAGWRENRRGRAAGAIFRL